MNIQEVHQLIDDLDEIINELSSDKRDEVEASELYQLSWIVEQVLDFGTAYSPETWSLGISAPLLNKIRRMRGAIKLRDARIVADRIKGYLRSLDQRTDDNDDFIVDETELVDEVLDSDSGPKAEPSVVQTTPSSVSFTFSAEQWTLIGNSGDAKAKIHAISHLLESIVEQSRSSNLPPEDQMLTELERKQLIAVLETVLAVLKAPMVEKGLLKRAGEALQRAAVSAAEKGVQKGIGNLAEMAAQKIGEFLSTFYN